MLLRELNGDINRTFTVKSDCEWRTPHVLVYCTTLLPGSAQQCRILCAHLEEEPLPCFLPR